MPCEKYLKFLHYVVSNQTFRSLLATSERGKGKEKADTTGITPTMAKAMAMIKVETYSETTAKAKAKDILTEMMTTVKERVKVE